MKQLFAYDFDKTLIPYDSFRAYLLHLIGIIPISICWLLILRKLRIIDGCKLKKCVTLLVESSDVLICDAKLFAEKIKQDIQLPREELCDATHLIITASPMVYMKYVVGNSKYQLLCSDTINDKYVEMYGHTKAEYLQKYYPTTKYQYVYAISDSETDMCWMKKFDHYEIIQKI